MAAEAHPQHFQISGNWQSLQISRWCSCCWGITPFLNVALNQAFGCWVEVSFCCIVGKFHPGKNSPGCLLLAFLWTLHCVKPKQDSLCSVLPGSWFATLPCVLIFVSAVTFIMNCCYLGRSPALAICYVFNDSIVSTSLVRKGLTSMYISLFIFLKFPRLGMWSTDHVIFLYQSPKIWFWLSFHLEFPSS